MDKINTNSRETIIRRVSIDNQNVKRQLINQMIYNNDEGKKKVLNISPWKRKTEIEKERKKKER